MPLVEKIREIIDKSKVKARRWLQNSRNNRQI